jgi:hypothetical protein
MIQASPSGKATNSLTRSGALGLLRTVDAPSKKNTGVTFSAIVICCNRAGAETIEAVLVFSYLLNCDPDHVGEHLLRKAARIFTRAPSVDRPGERFHYQRSA